MNNSYNVENGKGDVLPSWWQRRSKMEKKLTIFSALALLLIIILVIVIIIFFTRAPDTCLSASCVQATTELLEHVDTDVDPCDDFANFACGTFLDNTQLEDQRLKSVETALQQNLKNRIQGIVEEDEHDTDPRAMIMAKRLYKACLNLTAIEERGLRLIKDSLRQMGGWPALEGNNWKERDFDWKLATYKLRELGYDFEFLISMRILPDEVDPNQNIIEFSSAWNPLHHSTHEKEEILYNLMVNISVIFGVDRSRAKNEYRDVIDFIKSLFSQSHEDETEEDDKYDPLTMTELRYKFRELPWLEYVNRLRFPAQNITHDQIVTVSDSPYFLRLQNVLKRTTKRVLGNYIAMMTILDVSSYLISDVTDVVLKYSKQMNYTNSVPPRHTFCSEIVHYRFGLALEAAYVQKHFSKDTKDHVNEILQNIQEEFKEILTNLQWMDDETRTRALERLSSIKHYVGYPNDLLNVEKIGEHYMGYQMEEDHFLASILNANYYNTNWRFQLLQQPPGKDEELKEGYVTYTQSYYSVDDNAIIIPAAYLQGLIYDNDRPEYLNYGALGSKIGHEIFHTAFQGQSCGKIQKQYDWISTPTMLAFTEKLSCIAMHYGRYFVPEIQEHLNSSNTKLEDFADIVGVKLAYAAYEKWISDNHPEQKLPGFDYTPKQLFWIASAVRFCSKGTTEAIERSVAHNQVSLKRFRILGTLRNSEEFSRDFNCPAESFMNDGNKCSIW